MITSTKLTPAQEGILKWMRKGNDLIDRGGYFSTGFIRIDTRTVKKLLDMGLIQLDAAYERDQPRYPSAARTHRYVLKEATA